MEANEKLDNLSVLTQDEMTVLCASVFESKKYKEKSVTFVAHVPPTDPESYTNMELRIESPEHVPEQPLNTENVVCKAVENGAEKFYFITRSLNAEYSVFVQRVQEGKTILDAYIKNIALLIHTAFRPSPHNLPR